MISKIIFTKFLGWKFNGEFPKEIKKYVLIGAPHTSWKDFYVGLFSKNITGTRLNFVGKKSLFKPPFGFFFRAVGGTPIDRSKSENVVDAIIDIFNSKEEFKLAISPEGTRAFVEKWKTGFYYIAQGAKVPIVMFGFDFENKEVKLSKPFYTSGDIKADFAQFHQFYKNIKGANPELFNNQSFL